MATHPKGLTLGVIQEVNARLIREGQTQVMTHVETVQFLLDVIKEKDSTIAAWKDEALAWRTKQNG